MELVIVLLEPPRPVPPPPMLRFARFDEEPADEEEGEAMVSEDGGFGAPQPPHAGRLGSGAEGGSGVTSLASPSGTGPALAAAIVVSSGEF